MLPQLRRIGQHAALRAAVRQEVLGQVLDDRLGEWRFDVSLPDRRIEFSSATGQVTARAQLLASVASRPASLLWGWSPVFAAQAGADPAAAAVRAFGEHHQVPELLAEEVPYEVPAGQDQESCIAGICHDVGAAATVVFGPEVLYYTLPTGNGVGRIVLLLDSFSVPVPDLELTDVFVKLPRLLQDVDEVAWSLDGLARFSPGWRLEPGRAYEYRLFDAAGAWLDLAVSFDALQRVENVKVQGVNRA